MCLGVTDFVFARTVRSLFAHTNGHIADVPGFIHAQIIAHVHADGVRCGVLVGALFWRINASFGAR